MELTFSQLKMSQFSCCSKYFEGTVEM